VRFRTTWSSSDPLIGGEKLIELKLKHEVGTKKPLTAKLTNTFGATGGQTY
jgi:hypothetical protein